MTITVTDIVAGPFVATGLDQAAPFDFMALSDAEIEVIYGDDEVVLSPLLYAVNRNEDLVGLPEEGGDVVIAAAALTAGAQFWVRAAPNIEQEQQWSDTGSRLRNLNFSLDRLTVIALRLRYDVDRGVSTASEVLLEVQALADSVAQQIADAPNLVGNKVDKSQNGADFANPSAVPDVIGAAKAAVVQPLVKGRAVPNAVFAWCPIRPTVVSGVGDVSVSESPVSYARRTIVYTGDTDVTVVAPWGSDAGGGTGASPFRTIERAFTVGTSRIKVYEGNYPPFNYRADGAQISNRLRVIECQGKVNIVSAAAYAAMDDLSGKDVKATATITYTGLPVAGETLVLGGVIFTYRASAGNAFDILIGADATATATNTAAVLNRAAGITNVGAVSALGVVTLTSRLYGASGNATTLTETATNTAVSGSALSGGSDTWTAGASNTWKFKLNPSNPGPRAVLWKKDVDPDSGQPLPLVYYGPSRNFTFTGQPADGDTLTINGQVITFKTSAVSAGQCQIAATFALTAANLRALINNSAGVYGGRASRRNGGTIVRFMAMPDNPQTITASASGAQPAVAAQVSGVTNVENLVLGGDVNQEFPGNDRPGWTWDSAANELVVRNAATSIEANRADYELITASADNATYNAQNRCLLLGTDLAITGDISFRGTYIHMFPYLGRRSTLWGDFNNSLGRYTSVCSPVNVGFVENAGCDAYLMNPKVFCSHGDGIHPIEDGASQPRTLLINPTLDWSGDAATFPVVDFPNKNGASTHGLGSAMVIFGGLSRHSTGPELASYGYNWYVGTSALESRGITNEYGFLAILGSTWYLDTCSARGNKIADLAANGNSTIYVYNTGYRTSSIEAGSQLIDWSPPTA